MAYTLGQAGRATGMHKTSILRALKRGTISGTRDAASGEWRIEPAELHRVYKPSKSDKASDLNGAAVAAAELSGARALIAALESRIADLVEQRNGWQAQAEAVRQLTDQRERRRWWRKFAVGS
jgi:hypothetical protein